MRVLLCVPHFYRPRPESKLRSELSGPQRRATALVRCLAGIQQNLGSRHVLVNGRQPWSNSDIPVDVQTVLVTTGGHHLVGYVPKGLAVKHVAVDCPPEKLGYECHRLLRDALGQYDFYGYMEDDLEIVDGFFLNKILFFLAKFGDQNVLLPNRFELGSGPIYKLYVDGELAPKAAARHHEFRSGAPRTLAHPFLGREVFFETANNPHAGCFFLSPAQMARWAKKQYFLDRSEVFWGPLESAATLGILRTFEVFKPAARNAAFLELRHADPRHFGGAGPGQAKVAAAS